TGWIKTDSVARPDGTLGAEANLCLEGTWDHTEGLAGTRDWTYRSLIFDSGDRTEVTVGARLGYWADVTSGTAWFDDVRLEAVQPRRPHPQWRILALIYTQTDFNYVDPAGQSHHVVATMAESERLAAAEQVRRFVEFDLPRLSSRQVSASVTVRMPSRPLTTLSTCGSAFSPSPSDVALDRDPSFDSVVVYWDPRVTDLTTMQPAWIGCAAGLSYWMGTGQTYNELVIDAAVSWWASGNVLKHEFGHAILGYFEALGVTPQPTVQNHTGPTDYVHCRSGEPYVWVDETSDNPIPNSIYNNRSGFTHDYYSGTTATADAPDRCLGVTPAAWAWGGPATVSGSAYARPLQVSIDDITARIDALADSGALPRGRARELAATFAVVTRSVERGDSPRAIRALGTFVQLVEHLVDREQLPAAIGGPLVDDARAALRALCAAAERSEHHGRGRST
ncbi:MAG: hypothetical protein WCJ30_15955, partial [Deltaproteobacteria bacterium]